MQMERRITLKDISDARYLMALARRDGKPCAYRDRKKNYDRLIAEYKASWGLTR